MLVNQNQKAVNIMFGTGASSAKTYDELYPLIRMVLNGRIFAFDTAPSYQTEAVLGSCLKQCMAELSMNREDLFIQTKIDRCMANGRRQQEGGNIC